MLPTASADALPMKMSHSSGHKTGHFNSKVKMQEDNEG